MAYILKKKKKTMESILFIPYAAGDPVNGFQYEGSISARDYAHMIIEDYNKYKDMVYGVFSTRYGQNMSINPYAKSNVRFKAISWQYEDCNCFIRNIDGTDETEDNMRLMSSRNESCVLVMNIRKIATVPDVETEMKMWYRETSHIDRSPRLSDEEKIMNYPRKDLKIQFRDGNMAILGKCQLYDRNGSVYIIYVNRIEFIDKSKK